MIELVDAISVRLDEIFDGEYPIHLETVEQGLEVPCFFIHQVYASDRNMLSNRKHRTHEYDIIFIPDDEGYRTIFTKVTDRLFESFDSLTLADGTVLYTFDRSIDVVDDVLHFRVLFKFDYLKENTGEQIMQDTLQNKVSVIENGN